MSSDNQLHDKHTTISESSNVNKCNHLTQFNKKQLELCNKNYAELLTELFFLQHGGNYVDYIQFKKRPSLQLKTYLEQNSLSGNLNGKQSVPQTAVKVPSKEHDTSNGTLKDDELPKPEAANLSEKRKIDSHSTPRDEPIWRKIQAKDMPQIVLPEGYEETIGSQEEILERARQEAIVQRRVVELRKQGLWSQRRMPKVQEPPRSKTHWDYLLEEMRWLAADFAQERKWKLVAARKLSRMVVNYHKDSMEKEKKAAREEQQKLRRIASNIARQIRIFWSDIQKVVEYKQQCLLDEKRQKALDLHLNFIVDQTAKYSDWLTQGLTSQPNDSGLPSPQSQKSSMADSDGEFLPQGNSTDDEETIALEEDVQQHDVADEIALLKQESEMPFDDLISQLPKDLIDNIDKPFIPEEESTEDLVAEESRSTEARLPSSIELSEEKSQATSEQSSTSQSAAAHIEKRAEARVSTKLEVDDSKPTSDDDSNEDTKKRASISLRRSARKRKSEDDTEVTAKKAKCEPERPDVDTEFVASELSSDDEETIKEQEQTESVDHKKEIEELQAEGEMPIEELMKLYGGAFSESESESSKQETKKGDNENADEDDFSEEDEDIGVDYLISEEMNEKTSPEDSQLSNEPDKELTDVAAEAMSLQPTGHTLATTQVVTPIPVLLKHQLREYQHIGLDWLVTMYNKRLNGILADEMGLGKTIQTIALLAHLACDKGVWGPHLIVVPTSVILNWEMELKKWAPGFKILTYYGSQKERKLKRTGWTKSNAFHICITSYKLILQDHSSFRRKKWRYLILDEAQNIKNFKSQRWQALLNFNSQRRLLLTGTPLQNNLMELWSLMHFLMPHVFQSHKDFKEWFSNPMTGMIEGSQDFNEGLVQRLHQVLRPFILRRIKKDVEKQMPNKYEHVVKCHLSKRQRFLYEDFMSRTATKETLAGGHFMSVINVLMQLRKVCNHPNLFEPRPTVSPFSVGTLEYSIPSLVHKIVEKNPFEEFKPEDLNLHFPTLSRFTSHDLQLLHNSKVTKNTVEQIDYVSPKKPKPRQSMNDSLKTALRNKLLQLPQNEYVTLQRKNLNKTLNGSSNVAKGNSDELTLMDCDNQSSSICPGFSKDKMKNAQYSRILVERQTSSRSATLHRIVRINNQRCSSEVTHMTANLIRLLGAATINGKNSKFEHLSHSLRQTEDLKNLVLSKFLKDPNSRLQEMRDTLDRYVFVIPKVSSCSVRAKVSHPTPWRHYSLTTSRQALKSYLSKQLAVYHRVSRNTTILFPETRLIEYDCGKLQILNVLLRRFWTEKHRILIFTQMTKVLDILEMFLNYHGYRYLRLDGSTNVEERMSRMERFNNDPRIFCFILSTRSGGIGVNLTGADTVVFYDSDWNPTMDAQAQDRRCCPHVLRAMVCKANTFPLDLQYCFIAKGALHYHVVDLSPSASRSRCHRIGQTRDVHIYRLISEKTIEENILKKANQKRLLGDLAIEGGEFTTAFFKQQQIRDLFDDPTGLEELLEPQSAKESKKDEEKEEFEEALLKSEEKEDADAAALLKKEQDAMMEEFEDIDEKKLDSQGKESGFKIPKGSKIRGELEKIYMELTPIERYALNFLELSTEAVNVMELQEAEAQVEQSKKEWELAHLMALKKEEERRMEEADEIFYTREDNQVFVDDFTGQPMPIWLPPTPPRDEPYMDECCFLLYDTSQPMSNDSLSNVIVKKKAKQLTKSGNYEPRHKVPRSDVKVPKSLFNRHMSIKKREKLKQKAAAASSKAVVPSTVLSPVKIERASSKSPPVSNAPTPDWIINEDWELVQAVEQVLEMPLSLATLMPSHTPNWDLVADLVNTVSCIYRSAKECKQRFESVVASFEDEKIATPRKKLKTALKFPIKTKLSKSQQMNLSHLSDNNHQFTSLYSERFDACKVICGKRNPPKSTGGSGQFQRNPKHTNILHEKCGINYDQPLHPMQVAAARVKKLASQKKSTDLITNVIQPTQQVTSSLPQGSTIQHISGTIITSGASVVGKSPIQVSSQAIQHLTALPSGVHNVVNPSLSRKSTSTPLQGSITKLHSAKSGGTLLPLSSLTAVEQQFPTQPVSLTFTAAQSSVVTFTTMPSCITSATVRPSIAYQARGTTTKLSAVQHIRQTKQQATPHTTPIKQQIKQVNVSQQQLTMQQVPSSIMTGGTTLVERKKIQGTTLNQSQFVLQQHILKQRQIPQQQSRQVVTSKALPQKAIYATVPSHHLVVCGGTTAVKMTPHIQAQMFNQLVVQQQQQQQQQRRITGKSTGAQPPVTLTVTKLLQQGAGPRHSLIPQTSQLSQQTAVPVETNNMSLAASLAQPAPPRQFQLPQVGQTGGNQPHVTVAPTIVASTPIVMHRPPVVTKGSQLPQLRLRTSTATTVAQISVASSQSVDVTSTSLLVSQQHSTKGT